MHAAGGVELGNMLLTNRQSSASPQLHCGFLTISTFSNELHETAFAILAMFASSVVSILHISTILVFGFVMTLSSVFWMCAPLPKLTIVGAIIIC